MDVSKVNKNIKDTPNEVKQAVIDKWITYYKCTHLNQVMLWRKNVMRLEKGNLKVKIAPRKFLNNAQELECDFPLLDPDIN